MKSVWCCWCYLCINEIWLAYQVYEIVFCALVLLSFYMQWTHCVMQILHIHGSGTITMSSTFTTPPKLDDRNGNEENKLVSAVHPNCAIWCQRNQYLSCLVSAITLAEIQFKFRLYLKASHKVYRVCMIYTCTQLVLIVAIEFYRMNACNASFTCLHEHFHLHPD